MAGRVSMANASMTTLRKRIDERRRLAEAAIAQGDYKTADVHQRMMQLYTMQLGKIKTK